VVKIEDSSSNGVAECAYDPLGRRIRMIEVAEPSTFGLAAVLLFLTWLSA